MKLIHTADIHLDSPLAGVSDPVRRRNELVVALGRLSAYADNNGVSAIIVAGDLFDEQNVSEQTVNSVADIIRGGKAVWFILRGNHGGAEPYELLQKLCPQVKFFGDDWTSYSLQNVTVCGRELGRDDEAQWQRLQLDPSRYNIVTLHGDVDDPQYGLIDKNVLSRCGAKYVALGHRHAFCEHRFGRVRACYSGVLEARGFDESEKTGFVVIDTDLDEIKFVPSAIRSVIMKKLDVSDVQSDVALERKINDCVADVDLRNYLSLELYGEPSVDLHLQLVANRVLENKFFALRVKDNTRVKLDMDALSVEVSLRGEFVKLARQISDEKMREDVLKMGLAALGGEDLQ